VAVTSWHLAETTRLVAPDESFLVGLLHDIGKVGLANYFKGLFSQVWESMHNNSQSFCETEKELLAANHARIGAHLPKRWQLPDDLIEAIRYHHTLRKTANNPTAGCDRSGHSLQKKLGHSLEGAWEDFLREANGHYTVFKRTILPLKIPF
jgi:HD-like signal output (HDOD) protein